MAARPRRGNQVGLCDLAPLSCPRATLQVLHQACEVALGSGLVPGGSALAWATHYQEKLNSDQGCLNEWMAMSDLESFRPPNAEPGQSVPGVGWGLGRREGGGGGASVKWPLN